MNVRLFHAFSFFLGGVALKSLKDLGTQNCFRTLCGSLGQIRVELPEGSVEGSTKVPPKLYQGCQRFVVSLVSGGKSVSSCQKVLWKVPPKLYQGCQRFVVSLVSGGRSVSSCQKVLWKVPPKLYQGCQRFVVSLVSGGRSVSSCQKVLWKVPPKLYQGCQRFVVSLVSAGQMRVEPHAVGDILWAYLVFFFFFLGGHFLEKG